MKLSIKVVAKGGNKSAASVCPWIMDVPPETSSK